METMQTWFRSAIPAIAILRMRFEDASVAVSIIRNIVKQSVTVWIKDGVESMKIVDNLALIETFDISEVKSNNTSPEDYSEDIA